MILLALAACTPADPSPPVPTEVEAAPAPLPTLPDSVLARRQALREAEVARLTEALALATDQGDPVGIAEVLIAGREVDPDAFAAPWARFESDLLQRGADLGAARAAALLHDAARTPAERRKWRTFATGTLARWQHGPEQRDATLEAVQGVTRAMAHRAIATVVAEHVAAPGPEVLDAGIARLVDLGLLEAEPERTGDVHRDIDTVLDRAVGPAELVTATFTEAVLAGLDPWTKPIWPKQVASWQQHHDGVFPGIVGVVLDEDDGGLFVRQLVEGAPAWAAGVQVYDRVRTLDGEAPASLQEAVSTLAGANGTPLTLGLRRDGKDLEITVERASVAETTVSGWTREGTAQEVLAGPGVAWFHLHAFRPSTDDRFLELLPDPATLEAVVLDLRGNGGGDLDAALAIADAFVRSGPLVTAETRMELERPVDWGMATPVAPLADCRVAVLVDRDTGSSAEILAGALQHHGATVIGERTAGKGTGQILRTDEELGFAIQFTHLRWQLPDGRALHRADDATTWGITPDLSDHASPTERFMVGVLRARREALAVHADGSPMPWTGPTVDPALPTFHLDPTAELALVVVTRDRPH